MNPSVKNANNILILTQANPINELQSLLEFTSYQNNFIYLEGQNIVHSKQVTEEMHSQSRKLLKLADNNFKNYYSSYTQRFSKTFRSSSR